MKTTTLLLVLFLFTSCNGSGGSDSADGASATSGNQYSVNSLIHNYVYRIPMGGGGGFPRYNSMVFTATTLETRDYTRNSSTGLVSFEYSKKIYDLEPIADNEVIARGRNGEPDLLISYDIDNPSPGKVYFCIDTTSCTAWTGGSPGYY